MERGGSETAGANAGDPWPDGGSLWAATAPAVPGWPPLEGSAAADLAVVGGGYTGLSTALHAAERGLRVVLLEARAIGWGASGRNGGQVIAGLKEDPAALGRRFGPALGRRVAAVAGAAPERLFTLIQRLGIEPDVDRRGWLQPAAGQAGLDRQARRAAEWQAFGAPVAMLGTAELAARLGTTFFAGGLADARGGTIHPVKLAQGLAAAAAARGVRLHGRSPVTQLTPAAPGWRLATPTGYVVTRRVVLATNAYSGTLWPALRRSVVPVRSLQAATGPLEPGLRATLLPAAAAASDMLALQVYFRLDPDGRFVIGGRGGLTAAQDEACAQRLRRVAEALYPALVGQAWPHRWGGLVALTGDHLPHLHEPAPGLYALLGCNGRGVAIMVELGRVLADRLAGLPEAAADYPLTPLRPLPFHAFHRPVLRVRLALGDRRASRALKAAAQVPAPAGGPP